MVHPVHSSPSSPEPATNFTYLSFKSELRDSGLKLPDTAEDKTTGGRENLKDSQTFVCQTIVYVQFSESRKFTQRRLHRNVSYGWPDGATGKVEMARLKLLVIAT